MAGLACAHRLAEASVNFTLLEASDHVGGRALTDYSLAGGSPTEVGALMIHGRHSITHRWVRESGLSSRRLPVIQSGRFVLNNRVSSFPFIALPFHPAFGLRSFYQGTISIPRLLRRYSGPDMSLDDFLKQMRITPGARQLVTLLYAHAAAADPDEIGVIGPASEARIAAEEFGYSNFQLLDGYSRLAEMRASHFRDRIRLGVRVKTVRYSHEAMRIEAIQKGDGKQMEFLAKRAVITLPLGVLQCNDVEFDPALPKRKRKAIESIAFGNAMVVQMKLRDDNLRDRLGDFGILWGEGPSTFHRPYVGLHRSPNVLTAFTVGKEALRRSQMEDQELIEVTMQELEEMLPKSLRVGNVESWTSHRWPVDPFAHGGYSFLPPGADISHRRALAEPVDNVLFFAGEATHTKGESGTVHGAIETGYRAADEALRSLTQSKIL